MDSPWLALLAVGSGIAIGAGVTGILVWAASVGRRAKGAHEVFLPAGIPEVLDAIADPAFVVDPSLTVVAESEAAREHALVAEGRLQVTEFTDLVAKVRRDGRPRALSIELPHTGVGVAAGIYDVSAARVGSRFILVVAQDRTQRVALDRARRDFLGNVSHELKTPIGAITLLAEAIEMTVEEPEQVARFVQRLREETARLSVMTHEIIELSRLQAGDGARVRDVIDLHAVVHAAVDEHQVAASARGIAVSVDAGKPGKLVRGSDGELTRAISNLVSNAVRYSDDGGHVGVGLTRRGDVIEVAVTDRGFGISAADQERVFERFYRADPARSRVTGGTGLGLAIAKHVAQNHGGDISVWSKLGQGSTFTLRVPRAPDETAPGSAE